MTEEEREARLAALDAAIARALADVAAGRTKPAEEVFDRAGGADAGAADRGEPA